MSLTFFYGAGTVDVKIGCALASNFAQIMDEEYVRRSQSYVFYCTYHTEIRKTQRVGREMVIIAVMAGEGGG
jgi:hypothetical protein